LSSRQLRPRTINKYLGASYEVLASFGHVRDLPAKNGSVDPDANFQMIWEIDPKAAGRLNDIAQGAEGRRPVDPRHRP